MALVAHSTRDEGVYREWESGRRGYKTRWNRPVCLSVPIPPCTRAVVTWPPRPLASSSSIAAITPRALSIYTVSWKTFFLYLSVGETVENTISIAISLFEKSASPLSQRKEKAGYLDHHWGYFFLSWSSLSSRSDVSDRVGFDSFSFFLFVLQASPIWK